MENLGDLLYVLIIIVVAIVSVVKSFQKKQQQAAEMQLPQPVETQDWDEKELWDYREEGQRAILPEVIPEPVPVYQSPKKPAQGKRMYGIQPGYVSSSSIKYTDTPMESVDDDHAAVTLEDLPHDTNEWRKAFIYNEIFQKKYGR